MQRLSKMTQPCAWHIVKPEWRLAGSCWVRQERGAPVLLLVKFLGPSLKKNPKHILHLSPSHLGVQYPIFNLEMCKSKQIKFQELTFKTCTFVKGKRWLKETRWLLKAKIIKYSDFIPTVSNNTVCQKIRVKKTPSSFEAGILDECLEGAPFSPREIMAYFQINKNKKVLFEHTPFPQVAQCRH